MNIVVGMKVLDDAPNMVITVTSFDGNYVKYIWGDGQEGTRTLSDFLWCYGDCEVAYPVQEILKNFYGQ